jgi:hypothetical protein
MERALTITSKIISGIFTPFFIPIIAFLALFIFTYLWIMPIEYKLIILGIVASFTIFLPILLIFLFFKVSGMPVTDLRQRKHRFIPYILAIISFAFCSLMMYRLSIPWYMNGIILTSILIMIVFLLINLKWKISAHTGGMGAIIGGIVSLASVFNYNPVMPLCTLILIAGLVGSSRIILGRHTLNEVMSGFTVGLLCAVFVLHPIGNFISKYFY